MEILRMRPQNKYSFLQGRKAYTWLLQSIPTQPNQQTPGDPLHEKAQEDEKSKIEKNKV